MPGAEQEFREHCYSYPRAGWVSLGTNNISLTKSHIFPVRASVSSAIIQERRKRGAGVDAFWRSLPAASHGDSVTPRNASKAVSFPDPEAMSLGLVYPGLPPQDSGASVQGPKETRSPATFPGPAGSTELVLGTVKAMQIPNKNLGTPCPEDVHCLCGEFTRKAETSND